jgi:hypothetical protein
LSRRTKPAERLLAEWRSVLEAMAPEQRKAAMAQLDAIKAVHLAGRRPIPREQALELAQRPVPSTHISQQPSEGARGRGRPAKADIHIREAEERRRSVYARLKGRTDRARKNAPAARKGRLAKGDPSRELVLKEARALIRKGIPRRALASTIASTLELSGEGPGVHRIRQILRQLEPQN